MATNEMWPARMPNGMQNAASGALASTPLDGPAVAAVVGLTAVGAGLQVPAVRGACGRALESQDARRAVLATVEIVLRRCGRT